MGRDTGFEGEDIRGPNIPRRQQPEDLPLIEQYAIEMIPLNGKPHIVDESMVFDELGYGNDADDSPY